MRALAVGQGVDGAIDQSDVLKHVLGDYMTGAKNMPQDLKDILEGPAVGTGAKNLSITSLLASMMTGRDEATRKKLQSLAAEARDLGIDSLT